MGIRRIATALGSLYSAEVAVDFSEGSPPVINPDRQTSIARHAAQQVVGSGGVVKQEYPSMGAEDFSYYLHEIPGCYVRFGTRGPDDDYISLHSPTFDVDKAVLRVGASFFDRVTREALAVYGAGKDTVEPIPQTKV